MTRNGSVVDRSCLPPECRFDEKDGLYAEFHQNGTLKHLGIYINGDCSDDWALYLSGQGAGRAIIANKRPTAPITLETYYGGKARWTGIDDEEQPIKWTDWVMGWIDKIADRWRTLAQLAPPPPRTRKEDRVETQEEVRKRLRQIDEESEPSVIERWFVPAGCRFEKKVGLYAEFYESGGLKHLGIYVDGSCRENWALYLAEGKKEGRVLLGSGPPDKPLEWFEDGRSYPRQEEDMTWYGWVMMWMEKIRDRWALLEEIREAEESCP
jgi:hypothetical protein